jgi:two-component system OmpR family sensor kinase
MTVAGTGASSSSGTRSWPQRWLAGRTLRGRLIAGLLTLLAVACAAVGLVTYIALHGLLIGQVDQQLSSASQRYYNCEAGGPHPDQEQGNPGQGTGEPPPCDDIAGMPPGTFTAIVQDGQVMHSQVTAAPCHLTPTDHIALTAMPVNGQQATYTLDVLGPYRLMAVPAGDGRALVTGLPLDSVNQTLMDVAIAELIVFAAALLLTGVLGTGFVRLSLRPLRRVAATATRVTELPLASGEVTLPDRVPDADPRTEVGQVGLAFNRMLGHVEAALARRAASETRLRRFAADASHELRTPLAAIRGYAELARRHPGPIPGDIAHALSRVESESARMTVLVDELLLLAQLDAGRPLAREPVDLTRLAIDATSDARAASRDHRWLLELPNEPVQVVGDEHRLHQVLANLMSNAAKHTPPGTTVTVAVAPIEDSGPVATNGNPGAVTGNGHPGTVRLSVTDDGPGIPEDLQPALFERFVRGDSARSNGGASTGLGLAIVQAVTTAHGGNVSVASHPGQTSFVITLPGLETP